MDAMDAQQPLAESGDRRTSEVRRAVLLKRVAITLGGITAGGAAAAGLADANRNSPAKNDKLSQRDRQVLEFALRLEQLQNAFYAEAMRRGKLSGEVKQFAHTVGGEEHDHLAYIEHMLGRPTAKPSKFSFGDATTDDKKFVTAAAKLEDTGLAAYNGQAGNMSSGTLASVARVISVEARHAAWARSLAGQLPAPAAVDTPMTAAKAMNAIKPYLA